MELIIALIALGLERYLNLSHFLYRFNWFTSYVNLWHKLLEPRKLWRDYLALIAIIVPILVVVALVYYSLRKIWFGLMGILLGAFILFYCFGPRDFYRLVEEKILNQHEKDDSLLEDVSTDLPEKRRLSAGMFLQFNYRIFAVFFWFVVLGPVAAVWYRLNGLLLHEVKRGNSNVTDLQNLVQNIQNVFDWIPVRLLGIGFALVGHFASVFSYWIKHCLNGLSSNQEFLTQTGLQAIEVDEKQPNDEEAKSVLELLDRVMVLYLVFLALFSLGAWIY